MCDPQYDELNAMIAKALRADQDTVEINVSTLIILLAKAQMQRYPIYTPPPEPPLPTESRRWTQPYAIDNTTGKWPPSPYSYSQAQES